MMNKVNQKMNTPPKITLRNSADVRGATEEANNNAKRRNLKFTRGTPPPSTEDRQMVDVSRGTGCVGRSLFLHTGERGGLLRHESTERSVPHFYCALLFCVVGG